MAMPSTKYEGLSYPTHFLKSMGSGIMNIFLEYRTKQVNDEMLATIKHNLYSMGMFHAPVVTQYIVKV